MEGKLFYKNGALRFEGTYVQDEGGKEAYIKGRVYRKDGLLWMEGQFQRGGLRRGKEYYPNGQLMFSGEYNDRETGSYYGPPYPIHGRFYSQTGKLIYRTTVQRSAHGSLGYPYIKLPDGDMLVQGLGSEHFRE